MPTLQLRFPGGRYHATPWGHHVNEGLIEWPPSPWRLLRALLACGFATQGWGDVPPIARRLIVKLAAVLPSYCLPPASAAHSRHFMPVGTLAKGREQTTLVFDTWADLGPGELVIHWPVALDAEERDLLSTLATALGYLGRSQSWVEARLAADAPADWDAVPCREGEPRGPGWDQVALMAAIAPVDYERWRSAQVHAAPFPLKGKRPTQAVRQQEKSIAPYPPDLLACLTRDTAWWKGHGWSQPPGSQRVLYWRRSDALQVGAPPALRSPSVGSVTTMLLAITTASGNRSALPPVTRTLPQAELFHQAIIGCLGGDQRVDCPELTGKDAFDQPLRIHHRHAHTIPVDLDGDGRLDHLLIHAEMGLRGAAQQAIRALRRTWTKGGADDLQLAVAGSGDLAMLRRLPHPLDRAIAGLLGRRPEGARMWESVTPFVPPRTMDRRSKRHILGQLNAELASRQQPEAASVVVDPVLTRSLRHFVRCRVHGGAPPRADAGFGLRLQFAAPIKGPLLLGYAAHYGLGLFRACGD